MKLSSAIGIGQEWLKKPDPKIADFQVRDIIIGRVGNSEIKDRWYYTIEYQAIFGGRTLYSSPFTVKILMDGTAIMPIVAKDKLIAYRCWGRRGAYFPKAFRYISMHQKEDIE